MTNTSASQVKRKDAILTKCFHAFCYDCLRTRYETRWKIKEQTKSNSNFKSQAAEMSQVQCSIWCLRLSQVLKYLYFSQIFIGILYKYHFPVVPGEYHSSSGSTFREWPQQKQKRRSSAHRLFTGMDVLRVSLNVQARRDFTHKVLMMMVVLFVNAQIWQLCIYASIQQDVCNLKINY